MTNDCFIITHIDTKYTINSNKNNLEAKELLITNYEVNKELF